MAAITGLSVGTISQYLNVYKMPQEVWADIDNGALSLSAVKILAGLEDEQDKLSLSQEAATKKMSSRALTLAMDRCATKKQGAMTYSERRQEDIAKSLDELIAIRTRLEAYRDLEHVPPYIQKIEGRLQSVSRDVWRLCDELVESAREKKVPGGGRLVQAS